MTPRPAPRRATTRRYTLTLRRRLPNEHLLIEDLGARASGRRAQRIRALLVLGLDRDPPPNAFGLRGTAQAETGSLRITVLIHEVDPEDDVLRAALAQVGPLNRQEWLRDRLAAGLCGVDVPLDVVRAPQGQAPPQRSSAADTPSCVRSTAMAPQVADAWSDDAEEIPPAVTVEHDPGPTQGPEAIEQGDASPYDVEVDDDGRPKLNALAGLFKCPFRGHDVHTQPAARRCRRRPTGNAAPPRAAPPGSSKLPI